MTAAERWGDKTPQGRRSNRRNIVLTLTTDKPVPLWRKATEVSVFDIFVSSFYFHPNPVPKLPSVRIPLNSARHKIDSPKPPIAISLEVFKTLF